MHHVHCLLQQQPPSIKQAQAEVYIEAEFQIGLRMRVWYEVEARTSGGGRARRPRLSTRELSLQIAPHNSSRSICSCCGRREFFAHTKGCRSFFASRYASARVWCTFVYLLLRIGACNPTAITPPVLIYSLHVYSFARKKKTLIYGSIYPLQARNARFIFKIITVIVNVIFKLF